MIKTQLQVDNHVRGLSDVILNAINPDNISDSMSGSATNISDVILTRLMNAAPDGSRWTEPGEEFWSREARPSLRQHGVTLETGWLDPDIDRIVENGNPGASFSIKTRAPHLKWIVDDMPSHSIPRSGHTPLSFWWFQYGYPAFFTRITHPGTKKNDFPQEVMENSVPIIKDALVSGVRNILKPLRTFLSRL